MRNLLHLTYVMLKGNSLAGFAGSSKRRQKRSRAANYIMFFVLAVYMIGIMIASANALYQLLEPAGLQSMLVSLYLSMGVVLVFFFGVMYVISIFYHSSDVEKLLPMPLRPQEIIGAKLIVTAVYEYIFLFVLVAPALFTYGYASGEGLVFYLLTLLVILLLPVVPLGMAAILVMIIMRFTPFARNKDRFSMVSGLLTMVLALGLVFASQSATRFSQDDLVRIIQSGAEEIARMTASFFPGTSFAVMALVSESLSSSLANFGLLLLAAAASTVLTILAGKIFYFKGVIGLSGSMSRARKLNEREISSLNKSGSAFRTYVRKEFLLLFRTPIFFMNNVLMNFIWPLFFLIPLMSGGGGSIAELRSMMNKFITESGDKGYSIALAVIFAVACFLAGTNGITESALSREGKLIYIMKILPVSYTVQIWAKIAVGILLSFAGTLIMYILALLLLQPPFWFAVLLFAVIPGPVLCVNLAGMFYDLFWPKLSWDNEQKAVKQNMNVLYGMLSSLLIAALGAVPVFVLGPGLLASAAILLGLPLVLSALMARFLPSVILSQFNQLDV